MSRAVVVAALAANAGPEPPVWHFARDPIPYALDGPMSEPAFRGHRRMLMMVQERRDVVSAAERRRLDRQSSLRVQPAHLSARLRVAGDYYIDSLFRLIVTLAMALTSVTSICRMPPARRSSWLGP